MITLAEPKPISSRVRDKIDELRHTQSSSRTVHAVWWTAAVLASGVAVALALDAVLGWWSKPVRLGISLAVVASTISVFAIMFRKVFSGSHDLEVARVGDRIAPAMQERLQTVISAYDSDRCYAGVDRVMFDRVAHETDQLVDRLSAQQLRRERSWWVPVFLLGIASLGCVAIATSVGSDITVLVRRLLLPTSNLTRNQLEGLAGDQVIASGDSWETAFSVSGPVVDAVDLEREMNTDSTTSVKNIREQIVLSPKNGSTNEFRYRQHRAEQSFSYRLAAGDLRTNWYRVTVAERPRLTSVQVKVTPPAYSQLEAKVFSRLPNRITVIEGSTVDVIVNGAGKIAQATLNVDSQSPRMMWSEDALQFKASIIVNKEMVISPQLTEPNGLTNLRSPSCQILVRKDLPPSVSIKSPRRDTKVRPDDKVNITFVAKDDVGLAKMALVVEAESKDGSITTLDTKDIAVPQRHGEPAKTWEGKTQLDLSKYSLSEGQVLRYRIEAYDTRQSEMLEFTQADQTQSDQTSSDPTSKAVSTPTKASADKLDPSKSTTEASSSPRKSSDETTDADKSNSDQSNPGNSRLTKEESSKKDSSSDQSDSRSNSQSDANRQDADRAASEKERSGEGNDADQTETEKPKTDSSASTPPRNSSQPKDDAFNPAADERNDSMRPSATESKSDDSADQNPRESSASRSASKSSQSSSSKKQSSSDAMKRSEKSQTKDANSSTSSKSSDEAKPEKTNSDQSQLKISNQGAPPSKSESTAEDMKPEDRSSSENKNKSDPENQNPNAQSGSQSSKSSKTESSKAEGSKAGSSKAESSKTGDSKAGDSKRKSTQSSNSDSEMRDPSEPKSDQEKTKPGAKQSKSGDRATMVPPSDPSSKKSQSQSSSSRPDDEMSRRGIDLPRPSSSQSMRLEVTEYIGSFEGERRKKSEVAIAGTFVKTSKNLELARAELTNVIDASQSAAEDGDTQWTEAFQKETSQAEQHLGEAVSAIKDLLERTRNTPYAFIGVQLSEIAHTHIVPAKDDVQATSTAVPQTRNALLMAARQQTIRAIERLSELYVRFEKKKREVERDERVRKAKKMYLIYLEDSLAELRKVSKEKRGGSGKGLKRKLSEREYEEEYLKRLKEVFKMRNELRAELVKILADDPQLMRRYFQNFGERGASLRSQLNELADRQNYIYQQVTAFELAKSETEVNSLIHEHVAVVAGESLNFVRRSYEIEETFETWLPFQAGESEVIAATRHAFLELQSAGARISGHFESNIGHQILRGTANKTMIQSAMPILSKSIDGMINSIDQTLIQLNQLGQSDGRFADNVLRRMTELDRLRDSLARLNQKIRFLGSGELAASLGVDQWQLAEETNRLTEKLTGLQSELGGAIDRAGGTLPASIAAKCQQLLEKLDRDVEPMQLAAIRSLQDTLVEKAKRRTGAATEEMTAASELLHEILEDVIKLLDEIPPDPLAAAQDDPTLDEILAILEQERDRSEALGIPGRPTNLRIINDWSIIGSGQNGVAGQGGKGGQGGQGRARMLAMIRSAMKQQIESQKKKKKQRKGKSKKGNRGGDIAKIQSSSPEERRASAYGWNTVRTKLETGLSQGSDGRPPEAYRRSIDRHMDIISSFSEISDEANE